MEKKWSKTLGKHVFLGAILLTEFISVSPDICIVNLSQYGQKKKGKRWFKPLDKHVFLGALLLIEFIYVSPDICTVNWSQYGQKKSEKVIKTPE